MNKRQYKKLNSPARQNKELERMIKRAYCGNQKFWHRFNAWKKGYNLKIDHNQKYYVFTGGRMRCGYKLIREGEEND